MRLNRFPRPLSRRSKQQLANSAVAARPVKIEALEERQLMSLTVEVRDASGGSSATVTKVGQVLTLTVDAVITGTTSGANDGLDIATGSFLGTATSQADSVAGNLAASVSPTYRAESGQNGTQQDLNGDGNIDVGSNVNSDFAGFFSARAGGISQDQGVVNGDSITLPIGTITYTVTNLHYGSATDITFRPRYGLGGGAYSAVWYEDLNAKNDADGTYLGGSAFVISDPNLSPPNGVISGTVDKSVNGSTSAFAGVTMYLDTNDNGVLDAGEDTAVTNSSGQYSFSGLPAGTYLLREVVPSGYSQTSPSNTPTLLTLSSNNSSISGQDFTDTASAAKTGTISGTVSKVVNGSTSGFAGVSVALDLNGSFITGYTTSSTGAYDFTGLPANTYQVVETVPSGYTATTPSSGSLNVTLTSGQNSTGDNFVDTASSGTGPVALSGAVIGTSGSYKNDGNTIAKAFDKNLSTYYDGASANGNWAGLNLGAQYVISSVSYSPRPSWAGRMVGGIFQGSNDPNFATGVVNLGTISSTPATGVYTTMSISNTTPFQYVRYLSPSGSYGDVAEIAFSGTKSTVTHPKLTGTVIGTSGSYQNDGNTIAKAVDGSLSTFFDGPTANGNWVGLDLGSAKNITQISYAPRASWANRMVGGIFQVSNTANFSSGVVNIYTITSTPAYNTLTTVAVNVTGSYRYVRYLSPNGSYGDVAEINFYG